MAFSNIKKYTQGGSKTAAPVSQTPVSNSAQDELDDLLSYDDTDETLAPAPAEEPASQEAPAAPEAPAPQDTPAPPKAPTPKEKKPSKKKAPTKSMMKKSTPAGENDSKLRKQTSDPTATRVSARIPNDLYMDMIFLRAAQGHSMDYTITNAVQTVLRHKYSCACGTTFYMDAAESINTAPGFCPACGSNSVRKVKTGR